MNKPTLFETTAMVGALCVIAGFLAVLAIPAFTVSVCSKAYDIWQDWTTESEFFQ
jgi:hypothetical protein